MPKGEYVEFVEVVQGADFVEFVEDAQGMSQRAKSALSMCDANEAYLRSLRRMHKG